MNLCLYKALRPISTITSVTGFQIINEMSFSHNLTTRRNSTTFMKIKNNSEFRNIKLSFEDP